MNRKSLEIIVTTTITTLILTLSSCSIGNSFPSNTSYTGNPEFSAAASNVIDQIQNGEHGISSDMPWFTDIHGYVEDGIYNNDKLLFSIQIPEGWSVLTVDQMREYGDEASTQREVLDIEDDPRINTRDKIFDFMCTNNDDCRINVLFLYMGNIPYDFITHEYLNNIIRDSRVELELDPTATRVTHDDAALVDINGHMVYEINWTIYHGDEPETYRTELIDFYSPATRVIAIEYSSSEELDEILSCISYQSDNVYPNTESTTHTMATT
jgi:hypothetical protein